MSDLHPLQIEAASSLQELEIEIAKLSPEQQYLVHDCAHQVQQVLDRFKCPLIKASGVHLAAAKLLDSIKY
jgi:hypothetical protein